MNLSGQYEDAKAELQISPLIDVVFLLLIYFIVVAKNITPEGDIPFAIPADTPPEKMVVIPVEARIQIDKNDKVTINHGMSFPNTDKELKGLITQLKKMKTMAEAQKSTFFVTLDPTDDTKHQRIVDVMDACAEAKVRNLTFTNNE